MDMGGKIRLHYGDIELDLGTLETYSETFSKSCSATAIVSKDMEDAIAIESGSGINLSLRCRRVAEGDATAGADSTKWNNEHWYNMLTVAVNRWQALTNGFTLVYEPDATNPYMPPFEYQGYVKNVSRSYNKADPTVIHLNLEFHVGTMTMMDGVPSPIRGRFRSEFQISMTDSQNVVPYPLVHYRKDPDTGADIEVGCVDSYTMYGGVNTPFEYVVMKIPQRGLETMAAPLVNDIRPGHNRIRISAIGEGEFIVSKVKASGSTYTITAYCLAEKYRGCVIQGTGAFSALGWIDEILTSGTYGMTFTKEGDDPTYICKATDLKGGADQLEFEAGTNVWYILQICAMYIGCRIFFTGTKAYLVDLRQRADGKMVFDEGSLDLFPEPDTKLYGRIKGSATVGSEGTDTLVNVQSVVCTDPTSENTTSTKFTYRDEDSIECYGGEYNGADLTAKSLLQGGEFGQAEQLARMFMDYRREAQRSITFTLKEMEDRMKRIDKDANGKDVERIGLGWAPVFHDAAYARSIYDIGTQEGITYASDIATMDVPQKLLLSSWERHYPEGTTTYAFGVISNIDLASSTSQILGTTNNL